MIKATEKALTKSGISSILTQFRADKGVGVLSPARYDILIAPGAVARGGGWFQSSNRAALERLSKSCEAAAFPGRSVSTQPNRIMGPVREMPYEPLYSGDLDLTFRVGQDMFERKFFEFWMDTIVNHDNNKMGYYDEYTRDMFITQLGPDDGIVYKIRLSECYPKAINAIDLGFDKTDEYTRQSVSIAFREYEVLTAHIPTDLARSSNETYERVEALNAERRALDEERAAAQRDLIGSILDDADRRASTPIDTSFTLNPTAIQTTPIFDFGI